MRRCAAQQIGSADVADGSISADLAHPTPSSMSAAPPDSDHEFNVVGCVAMCQGTKSLRDSGSMGRLVVSAVASEEIVVRSQYRSSSLRTRSRTPRGGRANSER